MSDQDSDDDHDALLFAVDDDDSDSAHLGRSGSTSDDDKDVVGGGGESGGGAMAVVAQDPVPPADDDSDTDGDDSAARAFQGSSTSGLLALREQSRQLTAAFMRDTGRTAPPQDATAIAAAPSRASGGPTGGAEQPKAANIGETTATPGGIGLDLPVELELIADAIKGDDAAPAALTALLRGSFGLKDFRDGQVDAILSVLRRQAAFVSLPTGYGKSLTYVFTAYLVKRLGRVWSSLVPRPVLPSSSDTTSSMGQTATTSGRVASIASSGPTLGWFALVVSPLIALVQDQIEAIHTRYGTSGLRAVSITANTGVDQQNAIFAHLEALAGCASSTSSTTVTGGHEHEVAAAPFDILFVSPERIVANTTFQRTLQRALPALSFVCFDEAHCICDWAHDFRPAYMYCGPIIRRLAAEVGLPPPTVLALTATATPTVTDAVCTSLGIATRVVRSEPRENLIWAVRRVPSLATLSESAAIRQLETLVIDAARSLPRPLLVYTATQAETEAFAAVLRQRFENVAVAKPAGEIVDGVAVDPPPTRKADIVRAYHAGMDGTARRQTQRDFMRGETTVLVATVAFGMGVDKANIRAVLHCRPPPRLEGYLQEAGRAGRDGAPAVCALLLDESHFYEHRRRLYQSLLSLAQVKTILRAVLLGVNDGDGAGTADAIDRAEKAATSRRTVPQRIAHPSSAARMAAAASTDDVNGTMRLVNVDQIAAELGVAHEVVETVVFGLATDYPRKIVVRGQFPKHLRCTGFAHERAALRRNTLLDQEASENDDAGETMAFGGGTMVRRGTGHRSEGMVGRTRGAARKGTRRVTSAVAEAGAEAEVLRALQIADPVWESLTVAPTVPDTLAAASKLRLPLPAFLDRVRGYAAAGRMKANFKRYSLLVDVAPELASDEYASTLAKATLHKLRTRLRDEVSRVRATFGVFVADGAEGPAASMWPSATTAPLVPGSSRLPSVDAADITKAKDSAAAGSLSAEWAAPEPALGRGAAMDLIVDLFHRANEGEVPSGIHGAKVLLGALDWTHPLFRHPYAGKLKDHDVDWVLKACETVFSSSAPPPTAGGAAAPR